MEGFSQGASGISVDSPSVPPPPSSIAAPLSRPRSRGRSPTSRAGSTSRPPPLARRLVPAWSWCCSPPEGLSADVR
jgi:hypothetical protein